jgi:6,7-dimethyl-8-ribityllumazine synthase
LVTALSSTPLAISAQAKAFEPFTAEPLGQNLRVGIVQARFNEELCSALRHACVDALLQAGVQAEDIVVATVPGALEIPFALSQMAQGNQFDALVALGTVIRGETYHFEIVANESSAGIMRVALDYNIPIANAILTTENHEQALVRAHPKGAEAGRVALEMANLSASIRHMADEGNE